MNGGGTVTGLLVRPAVYGDESVTGYVARLAWRNGFGSSPELLRALGLVPRGRQSREDGLKLYRQVTGISPSVGLTHSPFRLRGRQRICPQCFSETGYYREIWDYALLPFCLIHRRRLTGGCTKCHRPFSRDALPRCRCCINEDRLATDAALPPPIFDLCNLIAASLGFDAPSPSHRFPSFFTQLDADTLQRMVLLLGSYRMRAFDARPRKAPIKANPEHACGVITAAAEVLAGWPDSLASILLVPGLREIPRGRSPHHCVGHLYTAVQREFSGTVRQFLSDGAEHCLRTWGRGPRSDQHRVRRAQQFSSDEAYMPITSAAQIYGVSANRLIRWITGGELEGLIRHSVRGHRLAAIKIGQDEQIARLCDRLSLSEASIQLGLSECRVRELLEDRLLIGIAPVPGGRWLIDQQSIETLFSAIVRCTQQEKNAQTHVTLDQVLRYRWPRNLRISQLIRSVLDSVIHASLERAHVRHLAQHLWLEIASLQVWMESLRQLSPRDVARQLSVKEEVVYDLIRQGILATLDRGRLGREIAPEDLMHFVDTYVFGRDVARMLSTSPRALFSRMASAGIRPVSGPMIDGSRQYLYLREAIALVDFEQFEQKRAEKLRTP